MILRPTTRRRLLAGALLLAILLPAARAAAVPIAEIELSGDFRVSEEEIREVLPIEAGEAFTLEKLDMAVGYLRRWGIFDTIAASPVMTPDGVMIDFVLDQATIVALIDITGNYPFLENRVRKYLSLHAGDIYTPGRLEEQIDRIEAFYKRQGFVDTRVSVEEEEMPEEDGVALTFHIRRGHVLRYRTITIEGNRAYPDGRFVSEINTYKPYSERRLREAIRKLREFYHTHGYPRARIRVAKKTIDFEAYRVDLLIRVDEGPHVAVRFEGAPHISRRMLRKHITLLQEGMLDDFAIDASADEIRRLLVGRGYPDARVRWEKAELPDGTIEIVFVLQAGTPQRIKRLRFAGTEGIDDDELVEGMQNRQRGIGQVGAYRPEEVEGDDETIRENLRRDGYLDPTIEPWEVAETADGYALDVTIPVEPGPQTIVGEVVFVGNEAFSAAELLGQLTVRPGKPLDEPTLPDETRRLLSFYADNGYPYAQAALEWESDPASGRAIIRYRIDEGTLVRIGRILYLGDVLTSQRAIRSAMSLHEGDRFSYRKLLESRLNIRRLGPFASVEIETIGLKEEQPIVHLRVRVEERRPFHIDLGLNYSTAENLTGSLAFTNVNAFGWAKTNTLKITAGKDLSRAEVLWFDPRFIGSSFEMSTNVWIQYKRRPAFAYNQIAGAMGWFRRYRRMGFLFRYELDRNYLIEGDSTAADAESLRNNTLSQITLSGSFDSRNSFSYPTKGFYTLGRIDIFNEIGGTQANFVTFRWQGENEVTPLSRFTLSTQLRLSRILTIGSNVSVPTNELLFLGGDDTIRGYTEDSLGPTDATGKATGSRARWIFNEELRIRIWRALSWAFFYDMGSLENEFSDMGWSTVRKSVGCGLRYTTPVGPIRADYGFKLDRDPGDAIGRFHITFGYVF